MDTKGISMKKQLIMMGLIISIITSVFSVGGAWAVSLYRKDVAQLQITEVSLDTKQLRKDVDRIGIENINRDKNDIETELFIKSFHEWQLKDAEWKGKLGELLNQSMYYGKSDKLSEFLKLSDENKDAIPKKKKVE